MREANKRKLLTLSLAATEFSAPVAYAWPGDVGALDQVATQAVLKHLERLEGIGISIDAAAGAIGIHRATLFRLRSGERTTVRGDYAERILGVLAVDPNELLIDSGPISQMIDRLEEVGCSNFKLAQLIGADRKVAVGERMTVRRARSIAEVYREFCPDQTA